MEFTKLTAPTLKELFIQELQTMILSGKLAIGTKLPTERDLAQTMQVSRAVVNAGITELAKTGFLTVKPRIGAFVADYRKEGTLETFNAIMNYNGGTLREDEIKSILELRIALDTLAVQLTIPKISNEETAALKQYTEQIQASKTPQEAADAAFEFQHALALCSGNMLLPILFSSFKSLVKTLWIRYCTLYGIESLYQNTVQFYECIENRDIEKAVAAITQTVENTISGKKKIYF